MFTANHIIDAVQNGKKQFVKTFVTNENMADAMLRFVDAQTEYTKKAAKVGEETVSVLTTEGIKSIQNAAKFDFFKFSENISKLYTTEAKK